MDDKTDSEIRDALRAAREAYAAAGRALARAEAAAAATGAPSDQPAQAGVEIDTLTVKQLNVVEDDGTVRMIIANSRLTGLSPVRGEVKQRDDRLNAAGILFANDEGTECGGLVCNGAADRGDGGPGQVNFMTFDDYEQNESFIFGRMQSAPYVSKWIKFADQPRWSLADYLADAEGLSGEALAAVQRQYWGDGVDGNGVERMSLAEESDGSVGLILRDSKGRPRIRLAVPADGEPLAETLDADGTARSLALQPSEQL